MTNASLIQTAFLERSVAIIVALNDASIQLLIRLVLVSYLKFPGDILLDLLYCKLKTVVLKTGAFINKFVHSD